PDADPLSVQCLDALPFVHADHLFFLPLSGEILSQGGSVLFDDLGSILFYDLQQNSAYFGYTPFSILPEDNPPLSHAAP
ncbi:hypothetical protein, partial [Neomoorella thermoacetica]|uniref:hypothetical protein n=1 Tax=Neomoorella thermoacetica TaxID=1525 RepID=UPI001C433733